MAIKYHYDIEQGTDEWHHLRLGIITASNINVILTPSGKPAKNASVKQYIAKLASQRIYKRIEENFVSYLMAMGHLKEAAARDIYSENFAVVKECGFITNDNYGFTIASSPDGLISKEGGIEIKSRLAKFQIQTITADEVPKEFLNQCQFFLLVSAREWIDFVSYSPGLPLFVKKITPDLMRHEAIIEAMISVEEEVAGIMAEYEDRAANMVPTEWIDFGLPDEIEASS
jgi:hypothetical protein